MDKIRDFYGKDIMTVMRDACLSFNVSQEELDIEVLETGSPGIFGLCKKKARIRVQLKKSFSGNLPGDGDKPLDLAKKDKKTYTPTRKTKNIENGKAKKEDNKKDVSSPPVETPGKNQAKVMELSEKKPAAEQDDQSGKAGRKKSFLSKKKKKPDEPVLPPSEEQLVSLKKNLSHFFELTGYPMQVTLRVEEAALHCLLSGEHEELLIGDDGRVLNSLQHLLRKMMSRGLPEGMLLTLDVGDFRNRRLLELKEKALQMAVEVMKTGKTMMIPALSPAERREIHIILKRDKEIRSRSVGDGLFKKVLIYKPAKPVKVPSSSSRKQENK